MQRNKYVSQLFGKAYVKYVVSGFISLGADFLIFNTLLHILDANLAISVLGGMLSGLLVGFILNKLWTFKNRDSSAGKTMWQISKFVLLFLFNTVFTYYFIKVLKTYSIQESTSKLMSMVMIVLWNFYIYKRFIFRT